MTYSLITTSNEITQPLSNSPIELQLKKETVSSEVDNICNPIKYITKIQFS